MSSMPLARSQFEHNTDSITFLFDPEFFAKKRLKTFTRKSADGEKEERIIQGYANVKIVDRIGDLIIPMAFAKSLPTYLLNSVLRFNHDEGSLLGHVTDAKIDEYGLWIEATIGDWEFALAKWKQIEFGSLKALSIMGRTMDWEEKQIERPDGSIDFIWEILEFDLIEISVVEIPMNQLSLFSMKGLSDEKDLLVQYLRKLAVMVEERFKEQVEKAGGEIRWRIKQLAKETEDKTNKKPSAAAKKKVVKEEKKDVSEVTDDQVEIEVVETIVEKADEDSPEDASQPEGDPETEAASADDEIIENLKSINEFVQNINSEVEGIRKSQTDMDERLKALEGTSEDESEETEAGEEKSYVKKSTMTFSKKALAEVFRPIIREELQNIDLKSVVKTAGSEPQKVVRKTGEHPEVAAGGDEIVKKGLAEAIADLANKANN